MSELKELIAQAGSQMEKTVEHLEEALARVRAGKANVKILDGIMVEYYGSPVPLTQVGTVTVPDAKSIVITPWEKGIIRDIERAIINSPLGITPENNGELIRLGIPPLTEDRRRELVKQVKGDAENAKVSVRNARRDTNDAIKKSIKAENTPEDVAKDAEGEVQKHHDLFIKKIEDLYAAKEKEIMTVKRCIKLLHKQRIDRLSHQEYG